MTDESAKQTDKKVVESLSPRRQNSVSEFLEKTPRNMIASEMVSTEESYINALSVVVDLFVRPLTLNSSQKKRILSPAQVQALFSNIELIFTLNANFLSDLSHRLEQWGNVSKSSMNAEEKLKNQCIADIFITFVPLFKMYAAYASSYDGAIKLLEKLRQTNKKFLSFEKEVTAEERMKGLTLTSFLIMPIQRIPRYKLLLEEYKKKTDSSHPDYPVIENALSQIAQLATYINEAVREQQNKETMIEVQNLFSGNHFIVTPHRKFVRKGELVKIARKGKRQKYDFYLFNDMLVYGSFFLGAYRLHRKIMLDDDTLKVTENAPMEPLMYGLTQSQLRDDEDIKYSLYFRSKDKSFRVAFKSEQEKKTWIQDIQAGIGYSRQRTNDVSRNSVVERVVNDEQLGDDSDSMNGDSSVSFTSSVSFRSSSSASISSSDSSPSKSRGVCEFRTCNLNCSVM